MSAIKQQINQYLFGLVIEYEKLSAERTFLTTGVTARLAEVNAERQELVDEAQIQLDRLNILRVADGQAALTLQEIRGHVNRTDRGPRG